MEQPPCDLPQLLFIDNFLSSSIRILQNSISSSTYHQKRISIDFSKEQLCKLLCPSSQPTNTRIKYSNSLFHKISVFFPNQLPFHVIHRDQKFRMDAFAWLFDGSLSALQWIWQVLKRNQRLTGGGVVCN